MKKVVGIMIWGFCVLKSGFKFDFDSFSYPRLNGVHFVACMPGILVRELSSFELLKFAPG